MKISVKKFGGTSIGSLEKIRLVAQKIYRSYERGEKSIIVVSAMAGVTNQLVAWSQEITKDYSSEHDVVCSSGEQVTAGLLALALKSLGLKARSWMGWQLPLLTTDHPGQAEVISVHSQALKEALQEGIIPVVAGFQGITPQGRLTTLGRGGSDTTAVAIASSLEASSCQIFTDVKGVYTADPQYVHEAQRYSYISYDDMLSLAEHGARVLHTKAIEWARSHNISIQVLSSFGEEDDEGTWIGPISSSIRSLTQKTVLSGSIPTLSPCDAEEFYKACEKAEIPFLHWQVSPEGLKFLTWAEFQREIETFLPQGCSYKEMMLITLVGNEFQKALPFSAHEIPVKQYFRFPKVVSFMIEQEQTPHILTRLHQLLGLHEAV